MQSEIWLILKNDALSEVGLDRGSQACDVTPGNALSAIAEEDLATKFHNFDCDIRLIASRVQVAEEWLKNFDQSFIRGSDIDCSLR